MCFSGAMSAHTTVCWARTDTTASLMTTNTTKTNFTLVDAQFMPTQVRNSWLAKLLANHSNSLPNHSISSFWSYWPPSDSLRGLLVILSSFPSGFQAASLLTINTSRSNSAWLQRFTEVVLPSSQKPLPVLIWTTWTVSFSFKARNLIKIIQTRIMQSAAKRAHLRATTPVIPKSTPKKRIHASVRQTNCEFFIFHKNKTFFFCETLPIEFVRNTIGEINYDMNRLGNREGEITNLHCFSLWRISSIVLAADEFCTW